MVKWITTVQYKHVHKITQFKNCIIKEAFTFLKYQGKIALNCHHKR